MRLRTKAKIKRATLAAQDNATIVDGQALTALQSLYRQKIAEIQDVLDSHSDQTGILRLSVLRDVKRDAEKVLGELDRLQKTALFDRMKDVAALGVEPFAEQMGARRVSKMVNASVKAAADFFGSDGLQLSDRLWKIGDHNREVVRQAIQTAIIQGNSASEAAQNFLSRGQAVPASIQKRINQAGSSAVGRVIGEQVMTGDGAPYHNARRVFRTEINRAHIIAYRRSAFETDGVVGTRFKLSPNHPEVDICDMHARVNLYGLGPGVYPKGKSPLPAHPNTISYEEVVFDDEVTDDDKQGRQSREEWLKHQPRRTQIDVLGGVKKQKAFEAGVLPQSQFGTPWRVVKDRLARKGIDIDFPDSNASDTPVLAPELADLSNPFASRSPLPLMKKSELVTRLDRYAIKQLHFDGASQSALQSIASAVDRVLGRYQTAVGALGWIPKGKAPRAAGLYVYHPKMRHIEGTDALMLRRTFVTKNHRDSGIQHQAYLARRDKNIERMKSRIAKIPDSNPYKVNMETALEKIESATRWTHSHISNDPIFSTTAHEAGHAIFFQGKGVAERWRERLTANNVRRVDWYKVSEYAGTDEDELFAEVTAFFASGDEQLVPTSIRSAYVETLQNYERIR